MVSPPSAPFSTEVPQLLQSHLDHLKASAISTEVIRERGYISILGRKPLAELGFSPAQQRTPGILLPLRGVDGGQVGHQYRPDNPRTNPPAKPVRYENPPGSRIRLDCPPRSQTMLADPSIPLWITEGSKKADALASKDACAISLTGVWGFKGKNQAGGVTILADWDHVTLKDRTVYLAFDSDVTTKKQARQALDRLAEHLHRKGALLSIIYLPQQGRNKVGIDDYLAGHTLEEALELAEEAESPDDSSQQELTVPGFVTPDGVVGEMVVSDRGEHAFMVASGNSVHWISQYQSPTVTYTPTKGRLVGSVVHFAQTAQPYASQSALFHEVKDYIHRYLQLPQHYEDIVALYVLLTWVYEFAPSVPYLRVIGDWGSGKTRFLQVAGSICFRPIFASGAITPSPIFRLLHMFRGTLILDEADFSDSSAQAEIVKIFNNGYRPGFPVVRSEKDNHRWQPETFEVFSPKLIATRNPFKDQALESRCLTAEMMPLTRTDIPIILPRCFPDEVNDLRSKLLTFRLANLLKLRADSFHNDLLEPGLQPRLQEILIPLKSMLNGDSSMAETLSAFVHNQQDALFSRRRDSRPGLVLAAMIELHQEGEALTSANIVNKVREMDEEAPIITPERAGRLIKKLGFKKERLHGGRRVILWDEDRVAQLAATYGLTISSTLTLEKPSLLSLLSPSASETGDSICPAEAVGPELSPILSPYEPLSSGDSSDGGDSSVGYKRTGETTEWEPLDLEALDAELDEFLEQTEEKDGYNPEG